MAHGLTVVFLAWIVLWCIGEATARALFGSRCDRIVASTRLPLGISTSLCILEGAGYFLPIRTAVWLLLFPAVWGAVRLLGAARAGRLSEDRMLAISSLAGLAVGLTPVLIAGRFTAAAITNNDGTYYLTTAEWLLRVPWNFQYPTFESFPPAVCLTERVLHWWMWRTGTPNLMAAISALSRLESTQSLAIVTATLSACAPCSAIGVARSLGVERAGKSELFVGLLSAFSAASAFLGFQHMTGHLGAQALFPAACAAIISAARWGGLRRILHAALFFGASIALFADGSSVLLLMGAAACTARGRHFVRPLLRVGTTGFFTVVLTPFTVGRAERAARMTGMNARLPATKPIFPQRGWLPRSPLDDLSTLTGVDSWPPWPAAWPPNADTIITWVAAACGAVLLLRGMRKVSRRYGAGPPAVILATAALVGILVTPVRYLKGKILLTAAAFVLPVSGVGAALMPASLRYWLLVPYALGELAALRELSRPSRWKVVDTKAHDALVPGLAKIPAGSIIAFDGLGAPADTVLDAHRAHRAALLADLRPVQPGLDGGFYLPKFCADLVRPDPLPTRGYALQRVTSETLTVGTELARWGPFRLLEVDLTKPDHFVAAWAPTHGWLAAEQEPNGRVFRWGEWQTQGTLHVVAPSPCARLRGEARVVTGAALLTVGIGKNTAASERIGPDWASFETRPFATNDPVIVRFQAEQATVSPPDPAHAITVSRLTVEPLWQCGTFSRTDTGAHQELPIDLSREIEMSIEPPIGTECARLSFVVAGDSPASLRVTVDGGPVMWRAVDPSNGAVAGPLLSGSGPHRVTLAPPSDKSLRLLDARVRPGSCSD